MNHEEQQEYQEKMGSPEMEYLQYQMEQQPEEEVPEIFPGTLEALNKIKLTNN